ncbi:MAG: hypothetical protein ABSD73_10925 [Candidatus Bathyarchaeia archaeon]
MGKISGSIPNQEQVFLDAFEEYLKGKVSEKVRYEYLRIAKAFLKKIYGVQMTLGEPRFVQAVKDFLSVSNPYTFRNTLAAMKPL